LNIFGFYLFNSCAQVRPGYRKTGKYEVFLGKKEQVSPIKLVKEDKNKASRAPKNTKIDLIKKAKTIGDVF
jgi:hypothetical protein